MATFDAVSVGDTITLERTVTSADIYQFSALTGDFAPQHVDDGFMKTTRYGERIAHGVFLLGLTTAASTELGKLLGKPSVSYGYDRLRFPAPVFVGDELTIRYAVDEIDCERERVISEVRVFRAEGDVTVAARHILQCV